MHEMIHNLPALPPAAFIDGIGGPELVLIVLIVLLLFGGKGLPNAARTLGRTMREFKKATSGIESEIKKAMNEVEEEIADEPAPAPKPPRYTRPAPLPPEAALPGRASAAAAPEEIAEPAPEPAADEIKPSAKQTDAGQA